MFNYFEGVDSVAYILLTKRGHVYTSQLERFDILHSHLTMGGEDLNASMEKEEWN